MTKLFRRKQRWMQCDLCHVNFKGKFEISVRKLKIVRICPECNGTLRVLKNVR